MNAEVKSMRPQAQEIYERVRADAYDELRRSIGALALSGLLAGFTLGATVLAYAAARAYLDGGAGLVVGALLYPVGYVGAILGRSQLFTENTLYPVIVSFEDRTCLRPTARLWGVVLAANLLGTLLFALIAVKTAALPPSVAAKIVELGDQAVAHTAAHTFWSAVLAGWLLALVAWLVESTSSSLGPLVVVWVITMVVGLLSLDHSVATAVQSWGGVLDGRAGLGEALGWWGMTVLGNVLGGVFIVSVVNYGQVRAGPD